MVGTRVRAGVAAGLVGLVAAGVGAGPVTTAQAADEVPPTVLQVGSYNVTSLTHDGKAGGDRRPWAERRGVVIAQILRESPDVLGVQEVHQSHKAGSVLPDGENQYLDLRNGLNKAGGSYELTNAVPHNCVREWTISKCVFQDNGASRTTRILYDTAVLEAVRSGSYKYTVQSGGANDDRYLAWAVFQHKASGKQFFFANTHLMNNDTLKQQAQWQELIAQVEQLKGDLPVVVVGDFQRSRTKAPASQMMVEMAAKGYGDVVGQRPGTLFLTEPRAQKLVNHWMNSVNGFNRNIKDWSFEDDKKRKAGNYADWVFASNHLPVLQWKVVVDRTKLKMAGVIPADHNMVRADLVLP